MARLFLVPGLLVWQLVEYGVQWGVNLRQVLPADNLTQRLEDRMPIIDHSHAPEVP